LPPEDGMVYCWSVIRKMMEQERKAEMKKELSID
jgi:hypothetical protein